jgi:hypothetical protein
MQLDGPAPSISGLFSSWLSLSSFLFRSCVSRAQSFAEGGGKSLEDAMMDVGCPPSRVNPDADELPPLDADVFAAALRERTEMTLRKMAEVVNEEPHACLADLTRDRVQTLFRELADEALALAIEQRIASAESVRGEKDSQVWVKKYRRMLAEEGRWPPVPDEERGVESNGEEEVSGHA